MRGGRGAQEMTLLLCTGLPADVLPGPLRKAGNVETGGVRRLYAIFKKIVFIRDPYVEDFKYIERKPVRIL